MKHHLENSPYSGQVIKQNKIDKSRNLLYFLIFFSFLLSMRFWIGWENRANPLNMFIGLSGFLIMLFKRIPFNFSRLNLITFGLVFIGYFFYGYEPTIYLPFYFLPYFIIICLNDSDKVRCLDYITKWYGYLMAISLIVYGLYFIIDLPFFGYQDATNTDWAKLSGYGHCKNYIFYMRSSFDGYEYRFNGPFLEPGHVGMISAFLLFVNQFNFKKKGMWFILFSLFFTFSLAGYVLVLFAFLMHIYYQKKITFRHFILLLLLFISIYLFGVYYNNGDNLIYEKILSRLEYDSEKGISGNNRVFGMIDIYYAALWTDIDLLLWGYPKETMEWLFENGSRGAGYTISMCTYGLIGTVLSILFYLVYICMSKYKKFAFLCLFFIIAMFWQRNYPFWTSWIICYIYGIVSEKYKLLTNKEK